MSVLPLSQNPRQSSSPSADAIGAKLVSPPLFQSMYSSASYSLGGTADGASARTTKPRSASWASRGWGVVRGILTLQWSAVGQKAVIGTAYGATVVTAGNAVGPATVVIGGSEVTTISDARGSWRI